MNRRSSEGRGAEKGYKRKYWTVLGMNVEDGTKGIQTVTWFTTHDYDQ